MMRDPEGLWARVSISTAWCKRFMSGRVAGQLDGAKYSNSSPCAALSLPVVVLFDRERIVPSVSSAASLLCGQQQQSRDVDSPEPTLPSSS